MAKTVWFLDYDGSLCPHQEVWEERQYSTDEICDVLKLLASKTRGLFWNTGRRVESLGNVDPRFLEYSGYFVQGSVRWEASNRYEELLGPKLDSGCKAELLTQFRDASNFRIEIKPTSARIAPVDLRHLNELRERMAELKAPEGWSWSLGMRGAELLSNDFSKATAVQREMARFPKAKPVALGDDFFDRPAVEAALNAGGWAVLIGEGCGWVTELAHTPQQLLFFETPDRFHAWLRRMK